MEKSPDLRLDWEKYAHLYKEITVPAKTVLLREGEISRQAYVIRRGCLRLPFNDNGKDITFQFFFEGFGVSSFESFRSGRPSSAADLKAFTLGEPVDPKSWNTAKDYRQPIA